RRRLVRGRRVEAVGGAVGRGRLQAQRQQRQLHGGDAGGIDGEHAPALGELQAGARLGAGVVARLDVLGGLLAAVGQRLVGLPAQPRRLGGRRRRQQQRRQRRRDGPAEHPAPPCARRRFSPLRAADIANGAAPRNPSFLGGRSVYNTVLQQGGGTPAT